jgi:excisionase family DNA binding protein
MSIDTPDRMKLFSDRLNEMDPFPTLPKLAWGLSEVSSATGLSIPFLRAEVRAGRLPVRRFGRRVLVRDEDLKVYLSRGSKGEAES